VRQTCDQARAKSLLATTPGWDIRLWISRSWSLEPLTTVVPGVKALYDMGQTCRLDKSCRIRNSEPCSEPSSCVVLNWRISPVYRGQSVPAVLPTMPHQCRARLWPHAPGNCLPLDQCTAACTQRLELRQTADEAARLARGTKALECEDDWEP
jgi:hypothetical protein